MGYDNLKLKSQRQTIKSPEEKLLTQGIKKGFPYCKGTYPDCPENPSENESMCRSCPLGEDYILQQKYKRRD